MATALKMPPVEAESIADLLRELVAGQRRIIELLEHQRSIVPPLSRVDRGVLAKMLPAVAAVYGPDTFTARDLAEDDRPGVRLVVRGRSVKQLAKLFARADGIAIEGRVLQRQGLEFQVTTWQIVEVVSK